MRYVAKLVMVITLPFNKIYIWAEHKYNTIVANKNCLKYLKEHDN